MDVKTEDQDAFDQLISSNGNLNGDVKSPGSRKNSKLNLFATSSDDDEKKLKKQAKAAAKAEKAEEKKRRKAEKAAAKAAEAEEKALMAQHLKSLDDEIKKQAAENRRLEAENKKALEKYKKEVKSSPSSSPSVSRRNSFTLGRPSDSEMVTASVMSSPSYVPFTEARSVNDFKVPANASDWKSWSAKDDTNATETNTTQQQSQQSSSSPSNATETNTTQQQSQPQSSSPSKLYNSGCWSSTTYGGLSGNITSLLHSATPNCSFKYDPHTEAIVTGVSGLYCISYTLSNILVSSEAGIQLLINGVVIDNVITTYSNYRSLISSQTGKVIVELTANDRISLSLPDTLTFGQSDQVKQSIAIVSLQ